MYPLYLNWLLEKILRFLPQSLIHSLTHSITNSIRTPNISRHDIFGSFIQFSYSHPRIYHMVLTYDNCRHNAVTKHFASPSLRFGFCHWGHPRSTRQRSSTTREELAEKSWRFKVAGTLQWEILHKCRFLCLWMAFYCLIFMGNGWTSMEIHGHPYNGFNGP